jgi:nucleoside recognition membrane protein YjiH
MKAIIVFLCTIGITNVFSVSSHTLTTYFMAIVSEESKREREREQKKLKCAANSNMTKEMQSNIYNSALVIVICSKA